MKKNSILFCIVFVFRTFFTDIVYSAEIYTEIGNEEANIIISGEIKQGDYDKFIEKVVYTYAFWKLYNEDAMQYEENKKLFREYVSKYGPINGMANVNVILNSLGGDLLESMRIGLAIKEMALETHIFEINGEQSKCVSSCFFIWASGVKREVYNKDKSNSIGIHRVYFDPKRYKNLTSKQAEKEYKNVSIDSRIFLKAMRIPEILIEKLFNVPSSDIYWLTEQEIKSIDGTAPYWEEMLISKCGFISMEEHAAFINCAPLFYDNINFSNLMKSIAKEKCANITKEYVDSIKNKFPEIVKCKNLNSYIERWNRIENFLLEAGFKNVSDYKKISDLVAEPPARETLK